MNGFVGTSTLVRLVLRRDRIRLPLWVLGIVGVVWGSAGAVGNAYPTQKAIDAYADSLGTSPSGIAMAGPPIGLHTMGGVVLFEVTFTVMVGVSLMSLFLVSRHTRAEEEDGRAELVRSTVAGRHAGSAAALTVAALASVLVGVGVAAAVGSASVPAAGAVLFGASVAALGIVFAAITLCLVQVFTHHRTTLGAGLAVLGACYVVRAAGDVRGDWLVWLSPIGWSQATHPVGDPRWWPLLLPVVATGLLLVLAAYLTEHRDVGAGLVATRPGPPTASRWLAGPTGLAVRLQRGSLLAWAGGMFVLAALTGSLTREMRQLVRDNPQLADYFRGDGSLVDSFFGAMLTILALLAAGFAVSSALRLRGEETAGRLEALLATGLSRRRWMLSSLLVTGVGSLIVLAVSGFGLGLTYGLVVSDATAPFRLAGLALVYAPAVLTLAALAVFLHGWVPTWARLTWAAFGVFFVYGWLGSLLKPPGWLLAASPFEQTPLVPVEPLTPGPLLVIAAVTVVLTAAGVLGFRRRDLA